MKALSYLFLAFLYACSQTPVVDSSQTDESGLSKVKHSGFDKAFVAMEAHIASYKGFMFAPLDFSEMDIVEPDDRAGRDSDWDFTEEDKKQWSDYYAKAMSETLTKYLPLASAPGPDILQINSKITHFAPSTPKYDSMDRGARDKFLSRTSGNMTIETQLLDSASNKVLANIKDNREMGNNTVMREATRGQFSMDLRNTFAAWARNFGKRLSDLKENQ